MPNVLAPGPTRARHIGAGVPPTQHWLPATTTTFSPPGVDLSGSGFPPMAAPAGSGLTTPAGR